MQLVNDILVRHILVNIFIASYALTYLGALLKLGENV